MPRGLLFAENVPMLSNDFGERAEKWRPRIPAQASSNSNQKDRKNGHTPQRERDWDLINGANEKVLAMFRW